MYNQIRKFFLVSAILMISSLLNAQVEWPSITQLNKPWTRWWWMGSAVNQTDLDSCMTLYQKAGLGGLEIVPIYGVKGYEKQFIPYLSPEWMKMLSFTLSKARQLNLGIDMANGTGWPFGGPWITSGEAAKTIYHQSFTLQEGQALHEKLIYKVPGYVRTESRRPIDVNSLKEPITENPDLQYLAIDQVKYPASLKPFLVMAYGNFPPEDITSKVDSVGKLCWKPEIGNSTIIALFQGLHGKMVERAAPGGEGYALDHFSANAIHTYFQKFDSSFSQSDLKGLRAFFNDSYEVDDARGQANWTPEFFNEFLKRRGYDLRIYLPLLFPVDSSHINPGIICDYRTTISELLLENYTQAWKHWSTGYGKIIRNQSHGSPANILDLYAAADIPETEGTDILRFKFASSAAHVSGKQLISSESATWCDEHFLSNLENVKHAVDKYFLGGVNHIFYHGTAYSPLSDPWPGWLFYATVHFQPANPFWPHFPALNNYVAHCQSFLQRGEPNNDVLLYYPLFDRFSIPGKELLRHFDGMDKEFDGTDFKNIAEEMLRKGYSFDYISDNQLWKVEYLNDRLLSNRSVYQTIIIPACSYMPPETLQHLLDLAKKGAKLIFFKKLPELAPGFSVDNHQTAKVKQLLATINFKKYDPDFNKASHGKGYIFLGSDLDLLLHECKIKRETFTDHQIQFTRRINGKKTLYFIVNQSKNPFNGWLTFNSNDKAIVIYSPLDERKGLAYTRKVSLDTLEAFVQMEPWESLILEIHPDALQANNFPYISKAGPSVPISNDWKIVFTEGGPVLPPPVDLKSLTFYTNLNDSDLSHFSGICVYSVHFKKPRGPENDYLLNLGTLKESAEVWLNHKYRTTLFSYPFQTIINTSDLKEDNLLEIKIANSMANRIIYIDQMEIPWKKFYNINMPPRLAQNKGEDGLFSAKKWTPIPSGLEGPVTLTPILQKTEY